MDNRDDPLARLRKRRKVTEEVPIWRQYDNRVEVDPLKPSSPPPTSAPRRRGRPRRQHPPSSPPPLPPPRSQQVEEPETERSKRLAKRRAKRQPSVEPSPPALMARMVAPPPTNPRGRLEFQHERGNDDGNDESAANKDKKNIENDIEAVYTRIKSVPNFSSKIAEFLRSHHNYSVHRRIVKKTFPRRKIITQWPMEILQADLIEYQPYGRANGGNRFILLVIDSFTKKIWAQPIKRKTGFYTAEAFEKIFSDFDLFPSNIITDDGKEFYNILVQKIFDTYGINHYTIPTKTPWKTPGAERAIRTIKTRLERYMVYRKSHRWLDYLPNLIKNYNKTPHRVTGVAPNSITFQNSEKIYKKLFKGVHLKTAPRLHVGDRV